ncbi:hypothetical protein SLE2022_354360 [Rubroshorea leprosula]
MAACGSLQHIFDNPLPENPTLLESLSPWNQIKTVKSVDQQPSSFTEIFGELHFKENPPPPPFTRYGSCHSHRNSESFSVMNLESLQLCTEGLGVESSDNVLEDLSQEEKPDVGPPKQQSSCGEFRRSRTSYGATYPPPISCIGETGKPWVWFKRYRQDGRFVLREMRIPTREILRACREDGRLTLHFVHPNDDEGEYDDEEEEDLLDKEEEESEEDEEVLKNEIKENLP